MLSSHTHVFHSEGGGRSRAGLREKYIGIPTLPSHKLQLDKYPREERMANRTLSTAAALSLVANRSIPKGDAALIARVTESCCEH